MAASPYPGQTQSPVDQVLRWLDDETITHNYACLEELFDDEEAHCWLWEQCRKRLEREREERESPVGLWWSVTYDGRVACWQEDCYTRIAHLAEQLQR